MSYAALLKAFKTRWNNASLDDSVTGGLHYGRAPSNTSMPFAVFTEVSHPQTGTTRRSRYADWNIQLDIYTDDGDVGTSAALAETVLDQFVHSDRASTNPFSLTAGNVLDIDLAEQPMSFQESDLVYRTMLQLRIRWAQDRTLSPG